MTARLRYGFLCDGAFPVLGKFTFQGVFDRINAFSFPAIHPEAYLVLKLDAPVGAHVVRIRLADSRGEAITEFRAPIESREFQSNDVQVKIAGMRLPAPGFYAFQVFLDAAEQPFGSVEFQAIQIKPPPADAKA